MRAFVFRNLLLGFVAFTVFYIPIGWAGDLSVTTIQCGDSLVSLDQWPPEGQNLNDSVVVAGQRNSILATVEKSSPNTITIWNTKTGLPVETLDGHKAAIVKLSIHPTSGMLVSTDSSGVTLLWWHRQLGSSASSMQLTLEGDEILDATFSQDGQILGILTTPPSNLSMGISLRRMKPERTTELHIVRTPLDLGGKTVILSDHMEVTRVTPIFETIPVPQRPSALSGPITLMRICGNNECVVAANQNQVVFWNINRSANTPRVLPVDGASAEYPITKIDLSADNETIVAVLKNERVIVLDTLRGMIRFDFTIPGGEVKRVTLTTEPNLLNVVSGKGNFRTYSLDYKGPDGAPKLMFNQKTDAIQFGHPPVGWRPGLL